MINKINSNPKKNCKNYCHEYNVHFARTTYIVTIVIFYSYVGQFDFSNSFSTFVN